MRRITIGQWMLIVGGSAGVFALGRLSGWGNGPGGWYSIVQGGTLLAGLLGFIAAILFGWSRPRLARAGCLGVGVLWSVATALSLIYLMGILGIVVIMFASLALAPTLLGAGSAWAFGRSPAGSPPPRRWVRSAVVLAFFAMPILMGATQWPLRLAFLVSRPAMDRLADRIAAGGA